MKRPACLQIGLSSATQLAKICLAQRSDPNEGEPPVVAAGLPPTVGIDIAAANPTRVAHPLLFTLALRAAGKKPVATPHARSGRARRLTLFRSAGDTIYIAVGSLTFVVGAYANWFYRHRCPRLAKAS